MPDIAMCFGKDSVRVCPMKDRCYRHTATPTEGRQSYFMNLPLAIDGTCGYFSPIESSREVGR